MDRRGPVVFDPGVMTSSAEHEGDGNPVATWLARLVLRLLLLLARVVYRVRVEGLENLPATGGALLAPNHVALVDGLVLLAVLPRRGRFLVDEDWNRKGWLRPFYRALDVIPVSSKGGPRVVLRALREAGNHLDRGEVVCIFPEGQLSRTGQMQTFRRGV